MKYLVKFIVITLLAFVCTYAQADSKIIYIDLKMVLNESKAGKEAQVFLKSSAEKNIEKFKKSEASLKKKESELIAKKKILSKEEYKKMSDNLRKEVQNYQKGRNDSFQKLATQRTDARAVLVDALKPLLKGYSEKNNVSIIVNKKDVLYANPALDMTNTFIELLNKKVPSINLK